jgi:arylsulfatase A-like enzyme
MEDCLDHLTDQSVQFIRQHSAESTPFFLYFALTAPHKPVLPHPRYRGRTDLGPYADFLVQVDESVGRILQALDEAGVREDTLLFYSSDNGSYMYRRDGRDHVEDSTVQAYRPEHHTANGSWRGTKADIWEGGHRVPLLVRWPRQVPAGSSCSVPVCLVDLMATITDLLGVERPASAEDSHSFLPLLLGKPRTRPPIIHHSANGTFAIRDGRWKLVLSNGSGGRESPAGKPFRRPYQLFDLEQDPGENNDQIDDHPDVARRLEAAAREIIGEGPNSGR